MCEMRSTASRVCYTPAQLLSLSEQCVGISREPRRLIYSLGIRNKEHVCSLRKSIPVRVTSRNVNRKNINSEHRPRVLIPVRLMPSSRKPRRSKTSFQLSVLLSNLRSIRNKLDEVQLLLSDTMPDVAVFCESWLDNTVPDSYVKLPHYDVIRKDREQHGGGILTYIKNDLKFDLCLCQTNFDLGECKTDVLRFVVYPSRTMVISLYHPYWGNSSCHSLIVDFLLCLVSHGRDCHAISKVVVCGDFNGLSSSVPTINALLGTQSVCNFNTRANAQLDYVLTDSITSFAEPKLMSPVGRSDHSVIFCPSKAQSKPTIRKINFRKKTPDAIARFREKLCQSEFLSEACQECDVTKASNIFLDGLRGLYEHFFPCRVIRLRSDDKKWVKPSLKIMINDRDRAYSRGNSVKYIRLREKVIAHVKQLKNNFLSSAIKTKNPSTLWKTVKEIIGFNKKQDFEIDVNDLANEFSSVFSDRDMADIDVDGFDGLPSSPLTFTQSEIFEVLRTLKKGSPGPDNLPFWVFRDNRDILTPAIHHLCSRSVVSETVPDCLKRAYVTPIPKCSNPTVLDFRPISLLPILAKILEKVVLKKWLHKLVPKLDALQFAFIPRVGQGTVTALTFVMHNILSFLDKPGVVRMLLVDLSKAFDRVPHHLILNKLIGLQAPCELTRWIKSYLTSRSQCVRYNGKKSTWFAAPSGVPQGSVLAPFLFALTINDLRPKHNNSVLVKFADDLCLLHFLRHSNDDKLQEELECITSWTNNNGMKWNVDKTKVMNVQTKRDVSFQRLIDRNSDTEIREVQTVKLLGVNIDQKLSWSDHLEEVLRRIRRRTYVLHALRQTHAPPDILWKVYCALIRSVASYGFPAWCNIAKSKFQRLMQFEKRLCKIFKMQSMNNLSIFCSSISRRLANKALDPDHPLNVIYDVKATRYSTRQNNAHRKVKTNTTRFKNSFIKFA